MLIGLLCAFVAALTYGSASILQAVAIDRAGASGGSASDLVGLGRQPLYFVGLGLDGIGFVASVLALQFLPLFLVQAVVAASVGVTAVLASLRGAVLGRAGWSALGAAAVGLVLLSVSAAADEGTPLALGWRWLLLALVLPIGLMALFGSRLAARHAAPLLALGAGFGFTVVAVASRALKIPDDPWRVLADPALWAIVTSGIAAVVLFAMALQAGTVTAVSAVTFTAETVVPAAVGLAFLGDAVRTGFWPVAVAGFVLAVGGAILLARYAEPVPEKPVSS